MTNKNKRRNNNRPAQKRMRRLCLLYMNMNIAIPAIVGAPSSSSAAATGDENNQHAHHSNLRHGPLHIQAAENGDFAPGFVRRILHGHGNGSIGEDAHAKNDPLLRIEDDGFDGENHERRQLQDGSEWCKCSHTPALLPPPLIHHHFTHTHTSLSLFRSSINISM